MNKKNENIKLIIIIITIIKNLLIKLVFKI